MNKEITLAKCEHCGCYYPADEKCDCQKRRCVNCGNNIRTLEKDGVICRCKLNNRSIGYVECFEGWCKHWRKDRSFDENAKRA